MQLYCPAETTKEKMAKIISDSYQNGNLISSFEGGSRMEVQVATRSKPHNLQTRIPIRPPLSLIEKMMAVRCGGYPVDTMTVYTFPSHDCVLCPLH